MKLTLPKLGTWSPLGGLPNVWSSTSEAKTPRIGVFLVSLERSWIVDVQNGLALVIWTSAAQVMGKRRAGSQTGSLTPDHKKSGNRPLPDVCRWSAMGRWKALEESYNFGLDLIPIEGRSQELWVSKISGVQPGTISGLQLGSLGKKSHSNVAPAE
jgi:hypothetical protein